MKVSLFFVLSLITLAAAAQSPTINVPRPAYGYEQINSIPEGISLPADRSALNNFLAEKQLARVGFIEGAYGGCLPFLRGDLSIQGLAANLDGEVERMNEAISAAYERMSSQLSASGRSVLQNTVSRSGSMSADTLAFDIVAAAPSVAEGVFSALCEKVMADIATPRDTL